MMKFCPKCQVVIGDKGLDSIHVQACELSCDNLTFSFKKDVFQSEGYKYRFILFIWPPEIWTYGYFCFIHQSNWQRGLFYFSIKDTQRLLGQRWIQNNTWESLTSGERNQDILHIAAPQKDGKNIALTSCLVLHTPGSTSHSSTFVRTVLTSKDLSLSSYWS